MSISIAQNPPLNCETIYIRPTTDQDFIPNGRIDRLLNIFNMNHAKHILHARTLKSECINFQIAVVQLIQYMFMQKYTTVTV